MMMNDALKLFRGAWPLWQAIRDLKVRKAARGW
jgi:hypothetical protein